VIEEADSGELICMLIAFQAAMISLALAIVFIIVAYPIPFFEGDLLLLFGFRG